MKHYLAITDIDPGSLTYLADKLESRGLVQRVIGLPSALTTLVMSISMTFINVLTSAYGDDVVGGYGIQSRVGKHGHYACYGSCSRISAVCRLQLRS